MKTTLNLALPSGARERYALAWSIPVAAFGLVVLVVMIVSAVSNYRSLQRARATLSEVQQEEARLRTQEAALKRELERPALREVYRYSRFITGVIGRRDFSILGLMEKVTALLPGDVRLDALELDTTSRDRILRLAVSAEEEEALEKFLVNLEDSPDFADVSIISHGLPQEDGEGAAEPITVACQVRYVGGSQPE